MTLATRKSTLIKSSNDTRDSTEETDASACTAATGVTVALEDVVAVSAFELLVTFPAPNGVIAATAGNRIVI